VPLWLRARQRAAPASSALVLARLLGSHATTSGPTARVPNSAGDAARLLRASASAQPATLHADHRASRPTARRVITATAAPSTLANLDNQGRVPLRSLLNRAPHLRTGELVAVFVADGLIDLAPADAVAGDHALVVSTDNRDRLCLGAGIRARLGVAPGDQLLITARLDTGGLACINPALLVAALDAVATGDADADHTASPTDTGGADAVDDTPVPITPLAGRTRRVR
jgi:hypothetical protein